MCNSRALLTVAAIGGAIYTGGASLSLLGGAGAASGAAGAASAGLTGFQTASLVASGVGAAASAYGAYQNASAQEQIARNNAVQAEYAAQDAQRRGEEQAQQIQRQAASLKSTQRAVLASHGLDLTYGTAASIQDQTDFFAQTDVATTRDNAAREAYGRRVQGANYTAQADSVNPFVSAAGSLLANGGTIADRWYSYTRKG